MHSAPSAVWIAACPRCRAHLGPLPASGTLLCTACAESYVCRENIWHFLPADREQHYQPFLRDYTTVRHAEGRWSDDPAYYRALPDVEPTDPLAWQWGIRARTFHSFRRRVLPRLGPGLRVVDLGAGTGWLSHRLALLGHEPCAVDLSSDERDGLGAARHFEASWPRLRAEFDRLPLASGQADLVVFNASLHYSPDYARTFAEALRLLKPQGSVVVLDSPVYRKAQSGLQMLAERHAAFEQKFGTRSDSVPSIEFLTWDMLRGLERQLGLRFTGYQPWYGCQWALRPWQAWWRGKREPSRFLILVARRRAG